MTCGFHVLGFVEGDFSLFTMTKPTFFTTIWESVMFTFFQASNSRKSEIRFDFGRVELPLNLFKGNDGDIGISDLSTSFFSVSFVVMEGQQWRRSLTVLEDGVF